MFCFNYCITRGEAAVAPCRPRGTFYFLPSLSLYGIDPARTARRVGGLVNGGEGGGRKMAGCDGEAAGRLFWKIAQNVTVSAGGLGGRHKRSSCCRQTTVLIQKQNKSRAHNTRVCSLAAVACSVLTPRRRY